MLAINLPIKDLVGMIGGRDERQELVAQMVRQWSTKQTLEYLRDHLAERAETHFQHAAVMESGTPAKDNIMCYARSYDQAAKEIDATIQKIRDILG